MLETVNAENFDRILDELVVQLKEDRTNIAIHSWLEHGMNELAEGLFFESINQTDPREVVNDTKG